MTPKDVTYLLDRYPPLSRGVRRTARSLAVANPGLPLDVTLSWWPADDEFRQRKSYSSDGTGVRLFSTDLKVEGRQMERLYAFDCDFKLLGTHQWDPASHGTPGEVLASGRFAGAVYFALLAHREWFEIGGVPRGLPQAGRAHPNTLVAEVEIMFFGETQKCPSRTEDDGAMLNFAISTKADPSAGSAGRNRRGRRR